MSEPGNDKRERKREYNRLWMAKSREKLRKTDKAYDSSSDDESESGSSHFNSSHQVNEDNNDINITNTSPELSQCNEVGDVSPAEAGNVTDSDVDWDTIEQAENVIAFSTDESSEGEDTLLEDLAIWTTQYQINHNAVDALLKTLKNHGHSSLPSTCRTLLKTAKDVPTKIVSGMEYYYFGIETEIYQILKLYPNEITENIDSLEISFNIDGLPLFKSSATTLWPILCEVHLKPPKIFPVTLTIGAAKPDNLEFLRETIDELNGVLQNGIDLNGRHINIKLRCLVCDAPAKAMVKGIKLYSGYYGCDRCDQRGIWCGRITYQDIDNFQLRTDQSFRNQVQVEHHHRLSPFCHVNNLNMINQFPIDYMHQVCLGTMKRLLLIWSRGKGRRNTRMSAQNIDDVSTRLIQLSKFIPKQFARKPRSLMFLERWKATEFRQFLLYTGIIVLKGILRPDLYFHFLSLSVAIRILVSPKLLQEHADYAKELLQYFVARGKILYGQEFLVYNIHSMLHISDDAIKYGSLDGCSAFGFESYLQKLKKMVRSGKSPLIQIVKRIKEHQNVSYHLPAEFLSHNKVNISSQPKDNIYLLQGNKFCQLLSKCNEQSNDDDCDMLCRVYTRNQSLFELPCDSRIIGINKFDKRYSSLQRLNSEQLEKKAIMIEKDNDNYLIITAILHNF